jgi:predicted metalloprotease
LAVRLWEGTYRIVDSGDGTRHATGDFSVAYAVAHEYAHSLQAELGVIASPANDYTLTYPVYKTELHADCWAGVWANSAYYQGLLEAGDIEEAFQSALDLGEYDYADPAHHGTPAQRSQAFMDGYNHGDPASCGPYLTAVY